MTQESFTEFLDSIRKNWILFAAIVGAIFWVAKMQGQVSTHQETLIHIGNEGSTIKKDVYEMKGDVKEIKAILQERKK